MTTVTWAFLVVLGWVAVGLGAAFVYLGRRGYRSGSWYLLGAVLGPMFVPIAIERGRRTVRVLERSDAGGPAEPGITVVVGVDGSPESERALLAAGLFGGRAARYVLVTVLDPDLGEFGTEEELRPWRELLADRAARLPAPPAARVTEVVCGQPDRVLRRIAEEERADVLVVGHRGRGLSHRLLGSVADALVRTSPVPVLLAPRGVRGNGPGPRGVSGTGGAAP